MATSKRVFALRLSDEVFDKIGIWAISEHRSLTNYIEYVLIQHLEEIEKERGIIKTDQTKNESCCFLSYEYKMLSLNCFVNVYIFSELGYHKSIPRVEGRNMATDKRVFTLRLSDEVFDKIGILATKDHRSMTNYIEYVLIQHSEQMEEKHGEIQPSQKK